MTSGRDPGDGRTTRLRLTAAGEAEMRDLDRMSDALAASVLAPLDEAERERLLRAQAEVRRLLAVSMVSVAEDDPRSADARWCLARYFEELGERFRAGFDPARTLPADAADLVAPDGAFVLARIQGEPAGCGALKRLDDASGELMRMWVDGAHRGLGIGARHPRRARGACGGARPHTRPALHERRARGGAGALPVARLRRDRPLQRRPVRRALLREAAGGYPRSSAQTACACTDRSCLSSLPSGAAMFSVVVTERLPSRLAAAHCA